MIQVESVKKTYGGETVLDAISFTLGKKEKCGLVGRNGAGKTTLFRLICGLEEPDQGSIVIPKHYRLGYLNQHIHFEQKTILEEVCLGLPPEDKEKTYKAEAILFGLGFQKSDLEKSPHAFSGGYQLRLHLTKLLLSEPDCLLLDEPTNYLDILSIRWLKQFLRNWQGELIMISHDRQFLDSIITHTIGIHRKGLKKIEGPSTKLYQKIAQEEEVHEKTRQTLEKKREHIQEFVDRFGAKANKASQAQSKLKALNRLPSLDALCQIENLNFSFPAAQTASKILFKGNTITFSYTGTPLISKFSFEIEKNARLGIIGQNGKGKSTFLKLLIGELEAQEGSMTMAPNLSIGYFGQSHINRLDPEQTVEDEIQQANPKLSIQEVRSIAGKMMFTQNRAEKKIGVLSGGERSRVVLGKLLAAPCHLLLLDEPTNHLDVESLEAFMDALEEFEGAVVIITHSELVLERLATRLLVFTQSKQEFFEGTYSEFLEKGGWQQEEKPQDKKEQTYKESKKQRAEAVIERSKQLKPHLARISQIESRITKLEEEVEALNNKIIDDVNNGKSTDIAEKTKLIKENQKEINTLFEELEERYNAVDNIK